MATTVVYGDFFVNTDTYTTTGTGTIMSLTTNPLLKYAIQVTGTGGTPISWNVLLEGSLDGVNFTTILTHTGLLGNAIILYSGASLYPNLYVRTHCTALVLGLASNIVVTCVGA
jgi:hypothetical protein